MSRSPFSLFLISVAAVSIAASLTACSPKPSESDSGLAETPGHAKEWRAWTDPGEAGFSETRLRQAREVSQDVGSAAVMIVSGGHVVDAWGNLTYEYNTHSIRKSLVNALYGIAVEDGSIDLDTRLTDLEIDGFENLTDTERQATVRDLLAARSGIYRPAAYEAPVHAQNRPERGSAAPGERWYYNNWDFNVAGVIWEHATGRTLFEAFDDLIAEPLGMQDYEPSDGFLIFEPGKSDYPAQLFRMSTRDLARLGQLYIDDGMFAGRRILPAEWVEASSSRVSDIGGGTGYGLLWWTYGKGAFPYLEHLNRYGFFAADGAGGQRVVIIPEIEMVIVHRGDTDAGPGVDEQETWKVIDRVLAARVFEPIEEADTAAWAPDEGSSTHFVDHTIRLTEERRQELLGTYELSGGMPARIFTYRDRLFINIGGRMEAQIEPVSELEFIVPQFPGDGVRFERTDDGLAIDIKAAGRQMSGRKIQGNPE